MDCPTTTTTTESALKQQNNNKNNASNATTGETTPLSHDEVDFVPVATTTTITTDNYNKTNNNNHIINNKIISNGNNNFKATAENYLNSHTNSNTTAKMFGNSKAHASEHLQYQQQQQQQQQQQNTQQQQQHQQKSVSKSKKKDDKNSNNNNNNNNTNEEPKKKSSTKERLSLFSTLGRRISQKALGHKDPHASASNCAAESAATGKLAASDAKENASKTNTANTTTNTTTTTAPAQHTSTTNSSVSPPTARRQRTFVKSSSIARLLGNTYQHHVKKFEKHQQLQHQQHQQQQNIDAGNPQMDFKFHTFGGRRRSNGPYLDRFKHYSKDDADVGAGAAAAAAAAGKKDDDTAASGDDATAAATLDFSDVLEMEAHHSATDELQRATSNGLERFCDYSTVAAGDDEAAAELGSKTMRTLSRSLGRLWGKRLHSVDISTPDPEYKVSYLGNVLTGWAKGEGCVEKQLNTLWRNYTQNNKPDMIMRIKVCASGLKATTRQHGLTEYWANRITHCCAPKNYPRIFCWVYRHEGRKMKHELRCHAVLCSKEKVVQDICNTLKENLKRALREFKREKILKQNARLSLANAAYENPSLPRRKILLIVGGNNYRPPLERSKSAPKLMAIEEAIGEEEGEDAEETNEPEMKSCCQKDSLYPAMTLGRRHCRRGHSIRRTGKARPLCSISLDESQQRRQLSANSAADTCCHNKSSTKECNSSTSKQTCADGAEEQRNSYGSDESDDFEKLLKYNDYDTNTSLTTELLPYFDMQLHKNTSSSLGDLCDLKATGEGDGEDEEEPLSLSPTVNSNPMAHPEDDMPLATNRPDPRQHSTEDEEQEEDAHVALRRTAGVCSDGEEDYLDADDDMYFRQARILNILHRHSMRKMAQLSLSSDEGSSSIETNGSAPLQYRHQTQSSISSNASSTATTNSSALDANSSSSNTGKRHSGGGSGGADSDEGSISSGCETASTVTANQDDLSLQYRHDKQLLLQQQAASLIDADNAHFFVMPTSANEHTVSASAAITVDEIYQRLEARLQRRQNSDATTFSSSSTITLKMGTGSEDSQPDSPNELKNEKLTSMEDQVKASAATDSTMRARRQRQRYEAATIAPPSCDFNDYDDAAAAAAATLDDTDSECSDESGYVEYREEREKTVREKVSDVERLELVQQQQQQLQEQQQQQQHYNQHQPVAHKRMQKPQLPPKPMPRRTLIGGGDAGTIVATNLLSSQRTSNSTAV